MALLKLSLAAALGVAIASANNTDSTTPTRNSALASMQASLQKQRESLAKQRESVSHQAGFRQELAPVSGGEFIAPIPRLIQADCAALPSEEVEGLIATAAQKESLQPELIRAVMRQESGFRPCAVSVKGAQGLMQLMPATAAQLHVIDAFDPAQNVAGGAALLRQLLDRYKGDVRLALVAYNAGANRADDPNTDKYPAETQGYIAKILGELGITPMQSPSEDAMTTDADSGTVAAQDPTPAKPSTAPPQ